MHRIFGKKENVDYVERKGAYLVPIKNRKVAVVRTLKGLFLLGGGSELGETDQETIARECREEIGCTAFVDRRVCTAETYMKHPDIGYFHPIQTYYLGEISEQKQAPKENDHQLEWIAYPELKGKLFAEMQNWALEECWNMFCRKKNEEK